MTQVVVVGLTKLTGSSKKQTKILVPSLTFIGINQVSGHGHTLQLQPEGEHEIQYHKI